MRRCVGEYLVDAAPRFRCADLLVLQEAPDHEASHGVANEINAEEGLGCLIRANPVAQLEDEPPEAFAEVLDRKSVV